MVILLPRDRERHLLLPLTPTVIADNPLFIPFFVKGRAKSAELWLWQHPAISVCEGFPAKKSPR
jgi:hypothetical protein